MNQGDRMTKRFACYRHYNAAGELLYVGVTESTGQRYSAHKHASAWFEDIAEIKCDYFDSRRAALVLEAATIVCDAPKYNKAVDTKLLRRPYHDEVKYIPADDYRHVLRTLRDDLISGNAKST
jgi:excinuclease UvrABC nuclease subunit